MGMPALLLLLVAPEVLAMVAGGPVNMTIMGAEVEAVPLLLTGVLAPPPAAVMVDGEMLVLLDVRVKTDGWSLLLCRVLPPGVDAAELCMSTNWGG